MKQEHTKVVLGHKGDRALFALFLSALIPLAICIAYIISLALAARAAVSLGLISTSTAAGLVISLMIIGLIAFQIYTFFQRGEKFILRITHYIDSAIDFFMPNVLPKVSDANINIFFSKIYLSHISKVPFSPPRYLA